MKTGLRTELRAGPPPSFTPLRSGLLQRRCACGGTPVPTGECEACRKKSLQRKSAHPSSRVPHPSEVPPIVHDVLRSSGQPLDSATRAFMEPRFGHDFSNVRVHIDTRASESARAVNARAYTVGRDIAFANGQYSPNTMNGRSVLVHELTHVMQQRFASGDKFSPLQSSSSESEMEAKKLTNHYFTNPSRIQLPKITTNRVLAREAADDAPKIERSMELDPNMFIKKMNASAEREAGPFSCPKGYKDIGQFRLTAYVLAQENEFPGKPQDKDPCGLKGTFSHPFLFQTDKSPRGVKTQGSGMSLGGEVIHYKGNNCFEVLDCPKTKSGQCATAGRTVAVDTSVIPLRSELIIEDIGARVAEDTGGQINGAHIDIYYGTEIGIVEALKKSLTGKKVCRKLVNKASKKAK